MPETLLNHQDLYCTDQASFQRPLLLNGNDDTVAETVHNKKF